MSRGGRAALTEISWTHPRRRVTEILCFEHDKQVLTALHTLGLGCQGQSAPPGSICDRCLIEAQGKEPRFAYGLAGPDPSKAQQ